MDEEKLEPEEFEPDESELDNFEPEELQEAEVPAIKKKTKKWPFVLLGILLFFVLLFFAGLIALKTLVPYKYNPIPKDPELLGIDSDTWEESQKREESGEKIVNIALFGLDTRDPDSFKGRSDAIMILSVNMKNGSIKLISVMRDSFVPIDKDSGRVYTKINSAYATGGPVLAIKTLNTIFDLDISEYVSVNLFRLKEIVDVVGGIEVELTENEIKYLNSGVREMCGIIDVDPKEHLVSEAGVQHLNGIQAVSYARIRYTANAEGENNDYGRTDRQRYVMEQMFKKVVVMKKSEYLKIVKPIAQSCESSLSYGEILEVVIKLFSMNPTLKETRVPDHNYVMTAPKTSAGSVVYYDLNFAAKLIHAFIYDNTTPEKYIEANGVEKNNWYASGFVRPQIED